MGFTEQILNLFNIQMNTVRSFRAAAAAAAMIAREIKSNTRGKLSWLHGKFALLKTFSIKTFQRLKLKTPIYSL